MFGTEIADKMTDTSLGSGKPVPNVKGPLEPRGKGDHFHSE